MTRLGDKIKVERLETGRLARIEENVVAAHALPDPEVQWRPAWLRFAPLAAAACALVLMAGALGYWLRGGSSGGVVAGAAPVPAITTGPGESATVAVGDAIVTIEQNTQLSFRTGPDGRIDLDLERGKVDCDVTPRPGRPLFAVHAADVDVAVVGTAFSVERSGTDVHVQVTRGKVSVSRTGKQTFVAAGEGWPAATQVAAADPDLVEKGSRGQGAEGSRVAEPEPDPVPDPVPGAEPGSRKTGHGQQETGNGQRATEEKTVKTPAIALPAGQPPLASCTGDCFAIADNTSNDDATQSRALYTAVHNELSAGSRAKAITYANLYLRRFPKGKEAAAVKQLRSLAGGE